jgi:protein SCO1/2
MSPRIAAALAAALLAAGGGLALWLGLGAEGDRFAGCRDGGGTVGASIGGPFALTATTGERVTDATLIDRPTLIYFGYTFCPDFCPLDGAAMAEALTLLDERGVAANAAFVTVDPARDTAERLGEFVANLHPRLVGLRGDAAETEAAARAFRVYFAKAGDDPELYLMDHTTFTYLMAPGVGFLDFFRHGTPPAEIADRVACYAEALG